MAGTISGHSGSRRAGEGVEVAEDQAQVVVGVGLEEDLAGLGAVLHADHLRRDHHVVVDESADRVVQSPIFSL